MKTVILSLIVGLTLFTLPKISVAADFYQWVSDTGTVSATDDAKNIPLKFQAQAAKRTWAELTSQTDAKFTLVPPAEEKPVLASTPTEADISSHVLEANAEDCKQPVRSLPPVYRQVGDYTSLVYRYTDSCGNIVSEIDGSPPSIVINR